MTEVSQANIYTQNYPGNKVGNMQPHIFISNFQSKSIWWIKLKISRSWLTCSDPLLVCLRSNPFIPIYKLLVSEILAILQVAKVLVHFESQIPKFPKSKSFPKLLMITQILPWRDTICFPLKVILGAGKLLCSVSHWGVPKCCKSVLCLGPPSCCPEGVNGAHYLTTSKLIPKGQLLILEQGDKV